MTHVLTFSEAEQRTGRALARLAERVDAYERHRPGHAARIAVLAERLARRLRLAETDIDDIKCAALGHGLGLYTLRLAALERPAPLAFSERVEVWRHPLVAEQQLAKRSASRGAQLLARWHHEWWNGLGYPDMLCGEHIPVGARVIRVVESYEALRADRPHRPALEPAAARRRIAEASGLEFDPYVATHFLRLLEAEPDLETLEVAVDAVPHLKPIAATPDGETSDAGAKPARTEGDAP